MLVNRLVRPSKFIINRWKKIIKHLKGYLTPSERIIKEKKKVIR